MADRSILFSGPMVRALLDGRKTQTRRVINPQPIVEANGNWRWEGRNGGFVGSAGTHVDEGFPESAKHWSRIQPRDRLYVREAWCTWGVFDDLAPSKLTGKEGVSYIADGHDVPRPGKFRQGMHMPRWASRLTLIVTDVRVQRLREISRDDAIAEGLIQIPTALAMAVEMGCDWGFEGDERYGSPISAYAALWNSLNASRGFGWDANPWVVAVTFEVKHGNIDQIGGAS